MQNARVWQRVLGLARTVIEAVVFDEDDGVVVASVRPRKGLGAGAGDAAGGRRGSIGSTTPGFGACTSTSGTPLARSRRRSGSRTTG